MVIKLIATTILIISVSGSSYPDCTDPSTYTSYGKSTQYKGLSDTTAWDRTENSGNSCDFSSIVPTIQPQTCGDCDFDLEDETWYRFDQGPYLEIAKYSDDSSCPARGHCNGFYQIALLSSDIDSGNVNSKKYLIIFSDARDVLTCSVSNDRFMVEEFHCDKFRLYKFPTGWKPKGSDPCRDAEDTEGSSTPTPYSLCMTDRVKKLTLTANRKYFTEDDTPLTCTSEKSPQPPPDMTWKDPDDQDITSQATRDSTLSSLFKEVYSLSSSTLTSVTCQVDDKSHTFYRVTIETENVRGIAGEEVTATCVVTIDKFSTKDEEEFYFISYLNHSEVYYTTANISVRGDKIVITEEESGAYKAALDFTNTSIPENVKTCTENWSCGLRDPITGILIGTKRFVVTLKSKKTNWETIVYSIIGAVFALLMGVSIFFLLKRMNFVNKVCVPDATIE